MDSGLFSLIELVASFAVVMGLCLWELRALKASAPKQEPGDPGHGHVQRGIRNGSSSLTQDDEKRSSDRLS